MRLLICCAVILNLCFTSLAIAGMQYTQVNRSGGEGGNTTNEIMLDGARFKSVYTESDSPMMRAGFYVLATGPNAIYMVNPATRKYARFNTKDMQKMQQDAEQMGGGADQMGMKAEVKDFKATKDIDEAGPSIVGLPTRHYRYTISYQEIRQPPGAPMAMITNIAEVNEFWASKELGDLATPEGWTEPIASAEDSSGEPNPQLQEVERQMAEHGFVLKRVVTSKADLGGMMGAMTSMMSMGGGGGSDKNSMEVTALNRNATFAAGTFDLPTGFTEVDLFNLMSGGAMPDLKSVPGKDPGQEMPDLSKEPPQ